MILLAFAVALFAAIHLVPAVPSLKARLQQRLGARYGMVFGIAATVSLVLIVIGWRISPFVPVYEPEPWSWHVNYLLTLIAFLCLGIFIFRGSLRRKLRFPLAIGVMFWATGHLFANGDLAAIILFGGLGLYGLAHLVLGFANDVRPQTPVHAGHDLLSLLAGFALYGVMIQVHEFIIGVPVMNIEQLFAG